ncbi:MAG: protein kinase, partial [Planctomycetota bacterium]
TDLGLAFFAEDRDNFSQSKPKHIVGTADFLAPEIIVSPGEVRSISDIYSLGCTMYYAVTGKVPFPGGDTADKLRRQLEEMPIAPQRLNSQLDASFVDVIAAMMQKRPEDRVATADEVVYLLKPWTPAIEATSWQEINDIIQAPLDASYDQATIAETISNRQVPDDTASRSSPGSSARADARPTATSPGAATASAVQGFSRATTALVGLAVLIAIVAIAIVLSGA